MSALVEILVLFILKGKVLQRANDNISNI